MQKDLLGVSQATSLFYVLYTHPSMPFKTTKELIAYAKANPSKLNFGSSGNYTLQHFSGELFNHMAGVQDRARAVQGHRRGDPRHARRARCRSASAR